jgi:hypothetical protein
MSDGESKGSRPGFARRYVRGLRSAAAQQRLGLWLLGDHHGHLRCPERRRKPHHRRGDLRLRRRGRFGLRPRRWGGLRRLQARASRRGARRGHRAGVLRKLRLGGVALAVALVEARLVGGGWPAWPLGAFLATVAYLLLLALEIGLAELLKRGN